MPTFETPAVAESSMYAGFHEKGPKSLPISADFRRAHDLRSLFQVKFGNSGDKIVVMPQYATILMGII